MSQRGAPSGHMAASFTDLMASLMVIFVLLFIAYSNNVAHSKKSATESALNSVLEALRRELSRAGMDIVRVEKDPRDPYAIVVVMPDSLLFAHGSSIVQPGGERYLERFTPVFAQILCSQPSGRIESVVVEGHTDTTYLGAHLENEVISLEDRGRAYNLELSQERSMSVVRTCLNALSKSPDRKIFLGLLSASGRGQEETLKEFPGNAPQQRRVAFKVRVKVEQAEGFSKQLSVGPTQVEIKK